MTAKIDAAPAGEHTVRQNSDTSQIAKLDRCRIYADVYTKDSAHADIVSEVRQRRDLLPDYGK